MHEFNGPGGAGRVDYCVTAMDRPAALERLLLSIAVHSPEASVYVADQSEKFDRAEHERLAGRLEEAGLWSAPTVWRLPFDCGQAVARNHLVDATPGEYKLMLDDDFVFSGQTDLDSLVRLLDARADAGIVAGGVIHDGQCYPGTLIRRDGATVRQVSASKSFREHGGLRFQEVDYVPMFTLMRRDLFAHIHWDPELKIAGLDWDFFLRMQAVPYAILYTPDVTIDHLPVAVEAGYIRRRARLEFVHRLLTKHNDVGRLESIMGTIAEIRPDGQLIMYCDIDAQPWPRGR